MRVCLDLIFLSKGIFSDRLRPHILQILVQLGLHDKPECNYEYSSCNCSYMAWAYIYLHVPNDASLLQIYLLIFSLPILLGYMNLAQKCHWVFWFVTQKQDSCYFLQQLYAKKKNSFLPNRWKTSLCWAVINWNNVEWKKWFFPP